MEENLKLPSEILEPLILANSKANPSFFIKIKEHLDTSETGKVYFNDPKYQEIFNLFCKCHSKYKKFPKETTLNALIDRLEKNEEIKLYKQSIVKKMFSSSIEDIDPEFIEEQTLEFIKENKVYEAISSSQKDMEEGNYGGLLGRIESAVRVNFDDDLGLSIKEVDEIIERIDNISNENAISTGYPNLDSELGGGFKNKEIYVFAAIPGLGKTLILGNFMINAYLAGLNVAFYTFETATERLYMRLFNNLLNSSSSEFLMNQEESVNKIKNITTGQENNIYIKQYPANYANSDMIQSNLHDLEMYKNFKPDLIIIDYILIMATNDRRMDSSNSYKYYKTVTEEIRNIAMEFDVPVLSAAQLNRQNMDEKGGSKEVLSASSLSESRGILDSVDFLSAISQSNIDKKNNRIYLNILKNRNGATAGKIEYSVDYDKMRLTEGNLLR